MRVSRGMVAALVRSQWRSPSFGLTYRLVAIARESMRNCGLRRSHAPRRTAASFLFSAVDHLVHQRLVGQCHRPAQGVAEQPRQNSRDNHVFLSGQQISAQARRCPSNSVPSLSFGLRIHRPPPRSLSRNRPIGIVVLQGEAERIDAHMADGALGDADVLLDHLPHGQAAVAFFLRQARHVGRRARAASRRATSRPPSCRAAPDWSAMPRLAWSARSPAPGCRRGRISCTPSTRRHCGPVDAGDAVVLGQRFVEERVIGVEDLRHRLDRSGTGPGRTESIPRRWPCGGRRRRSGRAFRSSP